MNKVILIGRLTKDIDLRYTQSNKAVAQFTLAVNRPRQKDKDQEADFLPVVVWGVQAENCKKYLSKGSQIAVAGRMQVRSFDNNDGKKVYVTEVISENVEFLESKKETKEDKNPSDFEVSNDNTDVFANFGQSIDFDDSELPF